MSGLIKREDIDAVRERVRIEDVVSAQVTLKTAGVGSLKGLCPFHDERTPSFTVRPGVGRFHCFGCGESGDAFAFLMKLDGLSFTEAVELLAERAGVQLRYEESGSGGRSGGGRGDPAKRGRLLDANRQAAEFFAQQLFANPEAKAGRKFLADRAFTKADAERFGVGYAPKGWNHLRDYLQGRGFTQDELLAAGLVKQGDRSLYDAFRGRLIWPIKDTSGAVVGFGARKLYDDDPGPKFLNTSETQLYKKSQVFYGIEQAKKAIARDKRVVIVEGYGDVMAAHLSGVDGAIAACGTSFTSDHARLIRRLMGDFAAGGGMQLTSGQTLGGEVIFVFDGDSAGQKAAERAFGEDQRFHALTFVAVAADGMDPCDLRLASGPEAVRALVESRVPLFEFVIKQALGRFDLNTVDGRLAALRVTAGYVAGIRDQALQHGYARTLAGWIGMEPEEVSREVRRAAKRVGQGEGAPGTAAAPPPTATAQPDPRDPVAATERLALAAVLQYPQHVPPEFDAFAPEAFSAPLWRAVFVAISAAGGAAAGAKQSTVKWVAAVEEEGGEALAAAIAQLSVMVLPEDREEAVARYVAGVIRAVADRDYTRQIADARSRLQRTDAAVDPAGHRAAMEAMLGAEAKRRALREA